MVAEYKGQQISLLGVVYDMSVDYYYSTVTITSNKLIPCAEEVILRDTKELRLVVIGVQFNTQFVHTCVSTEMWKLMTMKTPTVQGSFTVTQLLKEIGMPTDIPDTFSSATDWTLPQSSFKSIMDELRHRAKINNGGAPRFYIDLDGKVKCVDLKLSYEAGKEVPVTGIVKQDVSSIEWMMSVPSKLSIVYSNVDEMSVEESEGGNDLSVATMEVLDSTGTAVSYQLQKYQNLYNTKKYSSRRVLIENALSEGVELGTTISINGVSKFVVSHITMTVPVSDEVPQINIQALCPALLEQRL